MASLLVSIEEGREEAPEELEARDCYQCGKCTAGCPLAERMDLKPHQIMRLVQLGKADRTLGSDAIWQCISCQTCSSRCPKSVDCAGIVNRLHHLSLERSAQRLMTERRR